MVHRPLRDIVTDWLGAVYRATKLLAGMMEDLGGALIIVLQPFACCPTAPHDVDWSTGRAKSRQSSGWQA